MRKEKGKEVILASLLLITDQLLKMFFISRGLAVINQGISFGIALSCYLVILLSVFLFLFLLNIKGAVNRTGLLFFFSGGLSNFIDRVFHQGVVDYINLPFIPIIPTFNLADVLISLGLILIIVDLVAAKTVS